MAFRTIVVGGFLAGVAGAAMVPVAARAAEPDTDQRQTADDVVVTGEKPVTVSASATKTDTPVAETPQSVSVIDAAEIAELGLQNLNQVLRYVPGVTPETRGSAAEVYDQFKLRGFDAPVYLDGLRQFGSASGYAQPQVDVSRLDRVEVLKGPASALYGQSSPGGLIDQSSKLPLDRPFYGAVAGSYGNYDLYRVDADVGGQLAPGVLARVYGSVNGAHDQQTYGRRERETVSGAVTVGAGSSTSLTLLAAYSHDPANGNYGVWPALGTLIRNPAGQISSDFYGGEPGDFFRREQVGVTYILRHDFGGGWTLRASGRYQNVSSRLGIVYTGGAPVDAAAVAPTLYGRSSYATRETLNNWTYDNRLTGTIDTGPLRHSLLFGVDRQVAHSDEDAAFGTATPIDVFAPVYGTMPTPQTPETVTGGAPFTTDVRQRQQGIYAQDQIAVGGLRVTLSGRQDWAHTDGAGQSQDDDHFTWRAGALYKTGIGLSPYVSYSTSFEPQATVLASGGLAAPSIGKQIEAGAKWPIPGTGLLLTAAWFRIEQSGVVVFDPVSFSATQVGKVRSQGVELEAAGSLPHGFNVRLAFSRQNVKDIEDSNPAAVGLGLATVGRGGASATVEWAPATGPAQGFAIGGAVRHVDSVYADRYFDGTSYNSPAYTVYDALVRYDLGKASPRLAGVVVGVNATNLFDRKYLTSCFANYGWCWYGNRRTVQGTIGFHW